MKNSCLYNGSSRRARLPFAVFFVLFVLFAAMLLPCLPIHGEAEIYKKVLRLHVIAASDSETDQTIKLSVRDAVLDEIPALLDGCADIDSARAAVCDGAQVLLDASNERLSALGAGYSARIEIGEEYYPTREYDGIRLPAGKYSSVRVILGGGEGKNWWCVLFPSLCLSAARRSAKGDTAVEMQNEDYIAAGFTPEQYRTITETDLPRYKVRFRILEVIGELRRELFD